MNNAAMMASVTSAFGDISKNLNDISKGVARYPIKDFRIANEKIKSISPIDYAENLEALKKADEAEKELKAKKNERPGLRAVLEASDILIAAFIAAALVFNQFIQSNPFFSAQTIQGGLSAFSIGFAAYLSVQTLITQASNSINPTQPRSGGSKTT